ncbi:hypothetical protein BU16DRAFT_6639 [Lophium mytilinum]|uniref:Uncharacterized protein n=1 Tax=Lophium mytilinum TaxID=390894 RepID=A0A6A6RDA1_9PEZI|nr:hypothetical protein BU16DRAFT_6639 [Lophium mytilinum]
MTVNLSRFSLSRAEVMFNPLYLLGPPLLLLVSIPLATFAVFTTSIAFSALLIRASVVYLELGVALVQSWLFVQTSSMVHKPPTRESSGQTSPSRQRTRRNTGQSSTSSQDPTIPRKLPIKSGSFASLIGNGGSTRDFEGVGGWRVSGEDEDEALWIGMNSRLELPAVLPAHQKRHQRSLTGDSQRRSWSPEAIRMSPVQSRARTPVPIGDCSSPEEYFSLQHHKRFSTSSDPVTKTTYDPRRKSVGGSSTSSASSRRTSLKGIGV